MSKLERLRLRRWLAAGLWTALIYSTLSVVRPISDFLKAHTPFAFLASAFLFLVLGLIMIVFFTRIKIRKASTFWLLGCVVALYTFFILLLEIPEEKIHFLQYGVLAFLVFQAIVLDWEDRDAYILAFLLTSLIGWGDEGIQNLLPNRYYDIRDVLLNSLGGALALFLTFIMSRERNLRL